MAVVVSKGPMSFNAQWPRSFCPCPGIPLCSCTSMPLTVWAISMSSPHVYTVLHANVSRQLCVTLLAHSLMWVAWSVNRLCRWDGTRKEVFCIVSLFVRVIEKKMKIYLNWIVIWVGQLKDQCRPMTGPSFWRIMWDPRTHWCITFDLGPGSHCTHWPFAFRDSWKAGLELQWWPYGLSPIFV